MCWIVEDLRVFSLIFYCNEVYSGEWIGQKTDKTLPTACIDMGGRPRGITVSVELVFLSLLT